MPTINISRKVFEQLVGKKLPEDKLKDRISYLGTDLDEVNKDEIIVEIFPNRPDMLSVQGFSRAFSSFIGHKTGLRDYPVEKSGEKVIIEDSVKDVRPYTACAIVRGLSFDDEKIKEVIDIQEKLHITYGRHRKKIAIGIYPLEKIKMPIRYMAKKPEEIRFHPLEGKKEMTARQILEQHPTGKEYGYLLEGKKLFPIFVDANNQVLSMPPIINSHNVGKISEDTKDVFIECSGFDFSILKKCLNMIVTALYEMGGKIYSMELHYGGRKHTTPDLAPEEIKLDIPYINRLLGLNLNEAGAKKCLERMGHGCKSGKVLVPAYRTDILHQADFAEDIAIAFGYENFEHIIPNVATIGQEDRFEDFKNKIAGLLTGLGFIEASTYSLSNEQLQSSRMNLKIDAIRLSNSISQEYDILRAWMVPSIIEIFSKNKHHEYPQNIFAIGRVFSKDIREEAGIREADRIAVGICHEKSDYTGIRQVLDYLFSSLGMKYDVKEILHDSFIEGRVGRASVHGKEVAYIGEISPAVLENWQLTMPVAVFELNLTGLFEAMEKK